MGVIVLRIGCCSTTWRGWPCGRIGVTLLEDGMTGVTVLEDRLRHNVGACLAHVRPRARE